MLETHENDEFTAAEAADGVPIALGGTPSRWEQLRCATRELLRLTVTRQRDNVRTLFQDLRSVGSKRTTALK